MPFITSWRMKDRQAFYAPLLPQNALCFDIGANHGEYTAAFLSLGARKVIAIEPQPEVANFITEAFAEEVRAGVIVVRAVAVAAEKGIAKLFISPDPAKSMSTFSTVFVETARANGRNWDDTKTVDVEAVTLDSLIEEAGVPDYAKIDVEGFEIEVFRGLSKPIALISFEFNTQPSLIEIATQCIERLRRLGCYEFNYQVEAPGEASLQFSRWVDAGVMLYTLRHDLTRLKAHGDIFARL